MLMVVSVQAKEAVVQHRPKIKKEGVALRVLKLQVQKCRLDTYRKFSHTTFFLGPRVESNLGFPQSNLFHFACTTHKKQPSRLQSPISGKKSSLHSVKARTPDVVWCLARPHAFSAFQE